MFLTVSRGIGIRPVEGDRREKEENAAAILPVHVIGL